MPREPEPREIRAQGAISVMPRGAWRLGWLSLGDGALTFGPSAGSGAFRIDLGSVTRLATERRRFVLTSKRVIRLTYRPRGAAGRRDCWVITARVGDWEAALSEHLPLTPANAPLVSRPDSPDPAALVTGLAGLAGTAALLLDYLAPRGYATTEELLTLTGAESEEGLLLELEEGFRHIEPTLSGSAIRYEGARFDARSGTVRGQSWWLHDALTRCWLASCAPTDVLVEDGEVLVVTSVPTEARGVPPSARVDADGRGLTVRGSRGYQRWMALPVSVLDDPRCAVSGTGTLVVRARRRRCNSRAQETEGEEKAGTSVVGIPALDCLDGSQSEE